MQRRPTQVLQVNPAQPEPELIAQAAALLKAGRLVAFPTETVYGLGANALDAAAVRGIFTAKNRPSGDPLITHIAALDQLDLVALPSPVVAALARRFWPGPLTLVLPKTAVVPAEVTAGLGAVGVRMPAHPVALALIAAAGTPIAAPSANLFSRPSPTLAAHVAQDLAGRIDMIVDGGATSVGLESTVLDLSHDPPRILRPGAITLEQLREILPNVVERELSEQADEGHALIAPGTSVKHYSPSAEVLLYEGPAAPVLAAMRQALQERQEAGQKVGLLLCAEDVQALAPNSVTLRADLGSCDDLDGVARRLFAGMRDLDASGAEVIFSRIFAGEGIARAIRDRLRRAAEGHIVPLP